jgi:hypothetical protein
VRIESLADLTPEMLEGKRRVAITAGASTPSQLTRQVIQYVESFGARTRLVQGMADGMAHAVKGVGAGVLDRVVDPAKDPVSYPAKEVAPQPEGD